MKQTYFFAWMMTMVLFGSCHQQPSATPPSQTLHDTIAATGNAIAGATLSIAVVNYDSIMSNYTFAVNANEMLLKQQEDARLSLNTKARQLQNDMADFQKKIENNAFLSRERAEQESTRLQKKDAQLQQEYNQLSSNLQDKQAKLTVQLQDSVDHAIKLLNANHRYNLIISTSALSGAVLYRDDALDITEQLINLLNSRCAK